MTKVNKPAKKYTHPVLGYTAEHKHNKRKGVNLYCVYDKDDQIVMGDLLEHQLLPLGFIEAPTEEVKGEDYDDWKLQARKEFYSKHSGEKMDMFMFRDLIEKHMPKPVEQELIPLDVEAIIEYTDENFYGMLEVTKEAFRKYLSKYGAPKQEEDEGITLEEAEEQIKQCIGIDTQQGTACIKCGLNIKTYLDGTCIYCHPRNKTAFEKSITPVVQKKRTREQAKCIADLLFPTGSPVDRLKYEKYTIDILKHIGHLSD